MATLYIIGHEPQVNLCSRHLQISDKNGSESRTRRVPLFDIDRVALVGRTRVSMSVIDALLRRDIPIIMLSRLGGLVGSFSPAREGDAYIRIRQYQNAGNNQRALPQAAKLVEAKLLNMRRVLQKLGSGENASSDRDSLERVLTNLRSLAGDVRSVQHVDSLRGLEGAGTAAYFGQLSVFFPKDTPFPGRSRRPPRDPANALLSFVYTLVMGEIKAAVAAAGLDPCLGCYHAIGYGRPALALDLIEPLRAPLCDLFVLRLLNLGIIGREDFERDEETGGFRMIAGAIKRFFVHYEKRMTRVFKPVGSVVNTDFRRVMREAATDYVASMQANRIVKPFLMP